MTGYHSWRRTAEEQAILPGVVEIVRLIGRGFAVLLDGFVLWMIAGALRTLVGPGWLATMVEKAGVALNLLALAPILVPMLLFGVAKILLESFATWRATGRWPRNEAFIARMKLKRAAKS